MPEKLSGLVNELALLLGGTVAWLLVHSSAD